MSLKDIVQTMLDSTSDSDLESGFFHEEITDGYYDKDDEENGIVLAEKHLSDNSVKFECVEQHGGEGEGEDFYTVYKFTKGDEAVFVKFQGWYQSYNGSEMTGYNFVTPKQFMVTVYE